MAGTSSPTSSSSSSCLSIGSFVDDVPIKTGSSLAAIKFLCSYGGRILPRCTDGKLRYVGGDTRVLSVDRSVTFSDLVAKMGELCGGRGAAVGLRCQMPTEDLDALVSITSDEDLASLIEEYDLAGGGGGIRPPKIRAFLHHPHPPPPSKGKSTSAARPPVPATVHRCMVHRGRTASVAGRSGHGSQRLQHHHQQHQQPHQHQFPVLHHLQQ
ncbi:uncharacterized protein M6B38_195250 [Iris pallida]|uniref:PB1 domain-containing protein n=1 Tax=Iris pallida TaxID=29817 RepID=A0AAX6EEE4_IRIPA|nr:uncharacterized protein M6B38_195250 [Iris pallida]